MASLTAHLVEAGDHGRLGFHPSCPVCRRERLFGALSSEPVVSRRAQAVLAGGVLALSTSAPAAAFAPEPDRRGEGVQVPEEPGAGQLHDPGFDPGGETALPFETAPVAPTSPVAGGQDQGGEGPLEVEPQDDPDARLVPPSEPDSLPTEEPAATEDAPVAPVDVVTPETTPAPSTPGSNVTAPTTTEAPSPDEAPARLPDRPGTDREAQRPELKQKHRPREAASVGPVVQAPVEAAPPAPVAAPDPEPIVVAQTSVPEADSPVQHSRTYVVAPGDSLWSIAKRLLGRDASPAQIAREVSRLWSLNHVRIGTGDPDLLMVGTQLSLR